MPPSTRISAQEPTQKPTAAQSIIAFYSTEGGRDFKRRTLSEILDWDVENLEGCHDYIQILFPLPEGSMFNEKAPLVDREVFEAFRGDEGEELQGNLRTAFEKICWFYGFEVKYVEDGEVKVIPGSNFKAHAVVSRWNKCKNHNHQRITRIIRSLRVLGLEDEALAFYEAVLDITPIGVSKRSHEYWRRAAERTVNIRPDIDVEDEEDDRIGPDFLQEWVRMQRDAEIDEDEES